MTEIPKFGKTKKKLTFIIWHQKGKELHRKHSSMSKATKPQIPNTQTPIISSQCFKKSLIVYKIINKHEHNPFYSWYFLPYLYTLFVFSKSQNTTTPNTRKRNIITVSRKTPQFALNLVRKGTNSKNALHPRLEKKHMVFHSDWIGEEGRDMCRKRRIPHVGWEWKKA